jgi:tRNA dimethylallyltransferase
MTEPSPGSVPSWASLPVPAGDELLVVVGPTASGKTELAVRLAERLGGEVVSADSVQIYREFNIGSGKPTAEERARVPHHLIDALDPLEPVDAQRFAEMGEAAIADIRRRGRTPIVCGGTFLWVKALVWGLSPAPPADPEVRARHQAIVAAGGRAALHARLAEVDPESAARLAPNDLVRVSRALEICELTGRPHSAWHAAHGFRARRHAARLVGVHREREDLDQRIAVRAAGWLAQGWEEEVRSLLARGYGGARAMGSVGYKQVREHIEGSAGTAAPGPGGLGAQRGLPARSPQAWTAVTLQQAIVRATRVFVRRQRTWLRDQEVTYVRL